MNPPEILVDLAEKEIQRLERRIAALNFLLFGLLGDAKIQEERRLMMEAKTKHSKGLTKEWQDKMSARSDLREWVQWARWEEKQAKQSFPPSPR